MIDTLTARVAVPDDVVFREVDGEAVLLNLATGQYFGLDQVGTRFWCALREDGRIRSACERLLTEYDVRRADLAADVVEFVETLVGKGLLSLAESADRAEEDLWQAAGRE